MVAFGENTLHILLFVFLERQPSGVVFGLSRCDLLHVAEAPASYSVNCSLRTPHSGVLILSAICLFLGPFLYSDIERLNCTL